MKKHKLEKQKSLIFIRTISILLIFGLMLFGVYSFVTIISEKDLLIKEAQDDYAKFHSDMFSQADKDFSEVNIEYLVQNYSNENTYITVTDTKKGLTERTSNSLAVRFNKYTDNNIYGIIEYDTFIKSISQNDYDEIADYLNTKSDKEFYLLVCNSFFKDENNKISPVEIELIKTDNKNGWYSSDEVIRTYKLNISNENDYKLYEQSISRNIIDSSFVLGNNVRLNKSEADNIIKESNTLPSDNICSLGIFTYGFTDSDTISIEHTVGTNNYIDGIYFKYIRKIDVIGECADRLIVMLLFIIASVVFMGVILSIMSFNMLKKQSELEQKQRELTNSMAHDLKTPLFIVSGYAENLIANVRTDKRDYYAQMIIEETKTMGELIHNMLDSSSHSSGEITPNIEAFNLSQLVKDMAEEYKEIGCDIKLSCTEDVIINADKSLIKCAITNLVDNAVKYATDKNSIVLNLTDKEFSISNKCENIKKSQLKKLWEPYYMIDNNSRKNGNGLGLAIVKNIFDLHKFKYGTKLNDNIITFWFKY